MSSLICTEFEWGLHYFLEYPQTPSWAPYEFRFGWLSLWKGTYNSPYPFDKGRASASKNDVSRERLAPVDITTIGRRWPQTSSTDVLHEDAYIHTIHMVAYGLHAKGAQRVSYPPYPLDIGDSARSRSFTLVSALECVYLGRSATRSLAPLRLSIAWTLQLVGTRS